MRLGIKELRNNLSRNLAAVREGHTITITDHGTSIAKIVPINQPSTLDQLILEGKVQPAQRTKRRVPTPLSAKETVSDLVSEQRR